MAEKMTFFDARRGVGRRVGLPQEAIYIPVQPANPAVDIEEAKAQIIAEFADRAGLTSEEVAEQLGYLKTHPEFAAEMRADFEAALNRAKSLSKDALRAAFENEMRILAEENPDPVEIERLQREGIVIPFVITKQAARLEETEQYVKETSGDKVGKIKTSKKTERAVAIAAAGGVTGVATYLDFTFAKEGAGTMMSYLVDTLGLQEAMQGLGQEWSELLHMMNVSEPAKNAFERAAYGENLATMVFLGIALAYLFKRKMSVEKVRDLFRFIKHPYHATTTSAALALFLLLGSGKVTKDVTEVEPARKLALAINEKSNPAEAAVHEAVKAAMGMKPQVQPVIVQKYETAFKTGKVAVGPLTASTSLSLYGDVADKDGKKIRERFETDMKSKPEAMAKYDKIKAAIVAVNSMPKYTAFGMKPDDGANQLLEYLTAPLPEKAEALQQHLDATLEVANKKASVTLRSAILGKLNPLSDEYWKAHIGIGELFEMQQAYPVQYMQLVQQIMKIEVLNEYLGDLEAQIQKDSGVKISLKLPLQTLALGFTEEQIKALAIPRSEFADVLDVSTAEQVGNFFWGTQAAWEARGKVLARDLIENRLGEKDGDVAVTMQRLGYQGSIWLLYSILVLSSIVASGRARKTLNRWNEADMDAQTEKLTKKEDDLADILMAYTEAMSGSVVAMLHENGIDTSAKGRLNDAFRAAVARTLREHLLARTDDPRSGKKLAGSPDAPAFINREKTRQFEGEERKQILKAYERQLSAWQDELAKNPFGTIEVLLKEIDPQFSATAQALMAANSTNPGTRERQLAVQGLQNAFQAREKALLTIEADRVARHIAKLTARRDAVQKMVGEHEDLVIDLDGSDASALTENEVIATYVLADIDTEIYEWQRALETLESRGATLAPVPSDAAELTNAEWEAERSSFLERSMARLTEGSAVAGKGKDTLAELNAFIKAIGTGIQPVRRDLEAAVQKFNPNASVLFRYGPSALRKGPTIFVKMRDTSLPGAPTTSVTFRYKVPSDEGYESDKVVADIAEWARPDGPVAQRLRVGAIFENTRSQYLEQFDALAHMSSRAQFEIEAVNANAELFDAFLKSKDILQEQKSLVEKLDVGESLDAQNMRKFVEPLSAIPGVWKSSITDAIARITRPNAKFAAIPGKRLVVAFDPKNKGYILAVPDSEKIPIDIDAIPESDKILIKRAALV